MSGVMIKTAVYMLIRYYCNFIPNTGTGFGIFILVIGAVSAFLGVLYALGQHDIKKLLAYHSIENIGIIFMGIGLAILFKATGHNTLYGFALVGALFHTINHATFKGLLFLGSGAILKSCHTRDIDKLGGLIKKMPTTALLFLIGSMAICAIPPFNGFMSEWIIYQSLLSSFKLTSEAAKLLTPLFAAMLAITGGLALACFVKAFGISFLGNPRSKHSKEAKEVDNFMKTGMWILAIIYLVLGIFPGIVFKLTSNFTGNIPYENIFQLKSLIDSQSSVSNLFILGALLVIFILVYLLIKPKRRVYETWDCGINEYNPKAQYTALGFAQPIRRIFSLLLRSIRKVEVKKGAFKYYMEHLEVEEEVTPVFEKYFYLPIASWVNRISDYVRSKVQCGSIHAYLFYISTALISILIYARS